MSVREFVDRMGRLRADVKAAPHPPAEVVDRLAALTARLRAAFTPEGLREAIASGASVPTDLEEGFTTLSMIWTSRRE